MLNMINNNSHLLLETAFIADDVEKRLKNLEKIVHELTETTTDDLSKIKSQIKELKETIKRPTSQLDESIENFVNTKKE